MPIDYKQFIHPEDRDALEKLEAIPMLDTVTRAFLKNVTEDYMHGINLAGKVRLSRTQMPAIYKQLEEVCEELKLPIPEFYLEMDPIPNAYTAGDTKPFVVVNSGLIELLDPEEVKCVIAHECGHILCHHVLYHTLAQYLVMAGSGVGDIFGLGVISAPLQWALMYWVRRSEFSADRVSAYVMKNAEVTARTMMRLSGGPRSITSEINMDEYLHQADEYKKFIKDSDKSKFLQNWMAKDMSHPFPAIRAAEVLKWFNNNQKLLPGISIGEDPLKSTLNW